MKEEIVNKALHSMNPMETKMMEDFVHAFMHGIDYAINNKLENVTDVTMKDVETQFLIESGIIERGKEKE